MCGAGAHGFRHSHGRARQQGGGQTHGCIYEEKGSQAEAQESQNVVHDRPRRKSSRRFLRIFFSSSSRSTASCSPTASRKEESNNSREGWDPARKATSRFSARWRPHSWLDKRAESRNARSVIHR